MRLSHIAIVLVAAVAIIAITPFAAFYLFHFRFRFDDEFHAASSAPEQRSWATSAPPRIVVDVEDLVSGIINVRPGKEGHVSASVYRQSLCKNLSQSVAEDALRFVHVEMIAEGEIFRIVVRPTAAMPKNDFARTGTYITASVLILIDVPAGARLDLRTQSGAIEVEGKPEEILARTPTGRIGLNLDAARGPAGMPPAPLKLGGSQGEAEVKFDGTRYQFQGVVEPIP